MKLEDLTALGVPEEQAKTVLSLHEKELGKVVSIRDGLKADNEMLKGQLAERDKDIETLKVTAGDAEAVKGKLADLQGKYEADTAKLQQQIAARDYGDAIRSAIEAKGVKFTSKAAERAFIADLREKKLKLDNGTLSGFDEFLESQKQADPWAFASNKPKPYFSGPSGGPAAPPMTRESFLKMSYGDQLKAKEENPDLVNAFVKGM